MSPGSRASTRASTSRMCRPLIDRAEPLSVSEPGDSGAKARCYHRPVFAIGREHPMKTGQMDSWFGYQGDQPGDDKSAGQPICTTEDRPAGVRYKDVPNEIQWTCRFAASSGFTPEMGHLPLPAIVPLQQAFQPIA